MRQALMKNDSEPKLKAALVWLNRTLWDERAYKRGFHGNHEPDDERVTNSRTLVGRLSSRRKLVEANEERLAWL